MLFWCIWVTFAMIYPTKLDAVTFEFQTFIAEFYGDVWWYCLHSVFSPWWYMCWFMHYGNRVLQYCNIPVTVDVIFISVISHVITLLRRTCPNRHKPPISHQLRRCSRLTIAADISNIDPLSYVCTHWGWMTQICVSKQTMIGSDNGLSPERHQAIIWTNAGILLIGPLGTNFSEILNKTHIFSFKKNAFESVVCEMSAIFSRPQCVNEEVMARKRWSKVYEYFDKDHPLTACFLIPLYRIMIEDVCLHVFNINDVILDLFRVSETHSWYTSLKWTYFSFQINSMITDPEDLPFIFFILYTAIFQILMVQCVQVYCLSFHFTLTHVTKDLAI